MISIAVVVGRTRLITILRRYSHGAGQVLPDSIDVTSYDGTTQTIQITITGTNDGPVVLDTVSLLAMRIPR